MTTERKDEFLTQMAMIFFRLWRKLVKMNFFSLETAKPVLFHMQLKTTSLLKGLPREKLEVNPFMSLKYTAHLPETSTLGKLELQAKKKRGKGQRDILNLKKQTMRFLSVCLYLCMSQCVSFFFLILLKL